MDFNDILKKIINVEQEIYLLFTDLASLENQELQNSKEYQTKLEILNQKLQEESFYFNPKVLDVEILLDLLEFFENEIKPEYFDTSLNQIDIDRIYIRAYQLLDSAIDTNVLEERLQLLIPKDKEINIDNIIKYVFPTKRALYKEYYEMLFMKKTMEYILNDKLYNIQEAIEAEKDFYTKQELQFIKYYIAFCGSPFIRNITEILAEGPLTKIIHEQITKDIISLKANMTDFLYFIDNIMFEDANDYIENLLSHEYNSSEKIALFAQLNATLQYLSKSNLELINEIFKEEKQDTIIKLELKEKITNELENRSYYNVGKSELKPVVQLDLTNERIETIKKILKIEHSIYKIYEQIVKIQSEQEEKPYELQKWIDNLIDAYEIEKTYFKELQSDYDSILQFSLAFNSDNLHLYSEENISKIELLNIKIRVKDYIEPIFNDLLKKELLRQEVRMPVQELKTEKQEESLIKFLRKINSLEVYKKVNAEIKNNTGNVQKELIYDQFSNIFTQYHLTDTLIETKFDCDKFPIINEDYLYIISLELEIEYDYLYQKVNDFMYETALQFGEYVKELDDEDGEYTYGYRTFLEAQVKAAIPFLSEEQLREIGYKRQKILVK